MPRTTKKTSVKKTTTRTTARRAPRAVATPVVEHKNERPCDCGCNCCHRSGFWRFIKKLLWALILLVLGFIAGKMCCGMHHGMMIGSRAHFENGCLVEQSVKCPKLQQILPAMDINQDGCITREEYRAVKKHMRREIREMHD